MDLKYFITVVLLFGIGANINAQEPRITPQQVGAYGSGNKAVLQSDGTTGTWRPLDSIRADITTVLGVTAGRNISNVSGQISQTNYEESAGDPESTSYRDAGWQWKNTATNDFWISMKKGFTSSGVNYDTTGYVGTTVNTAIGTFSAENERWQSFKPAAGGYGSVKLNLSSDGTVTGSIRVRITDSTGTVILAEKILVNQVLTTTLINTTFNFGQAISLLGGTTYRIYVTRLAGSGTSGTFYWTKVQSNIYANGQANTASGHDHLFGYFVYVLPNDWQKIESLLYDTKMVGYVDTTRMDTLAAFQTFQADSFGLVKSGMPNFVNVKRYGAKGDGVTDDRLAITAAVQSGNAIYFPDGTYMVSGGSGYIDLWTKSVYLKGSGKVTLKSIAGSVTTNTASIAVLGFRANGDTTQQVIIEGITFDGNHQGYAYDPSGDPYKFEQATLLRFDVASGGLFRSVVVRNCVFNNPISIGLRFGSSSTIIGFEQVIVDGCFFGARYRTRSDIEAAANVRDLSINNCHVSGRGSVVQRLECEFVNGGSQKHRWYISNSYFNRIEISGDAPNVFNYQVFVSNCRTDKGFIVGDASVYVSNSILRALDGNFTRPNLFVTGSDILVPANSVVAGTVAPTISAGVFKVDGFTITLTGAETLAEVATKIQYGSYHYISTETTGNLLTIKKHHPDSMFIEQVSGTALANLGITAGAYYPSQNGTMGWAYSTAKNLTVSFKGCRFLYDAQNVAFVPTGYMIAPGLQNYNLSVRSVNYFDNCLFDSRAEKSYDAFGTGKSVFRNCTFGGQSWAVRLGDQSGYYNSEYVDIDGDYKACATAFYTQGHHASGSTTVNLVGGLYPTTGFATNTGTPYSGMICVSQRLLEYPAAPTIGGIFGDVCLDKSNGDRYICKSTHPTAATWSKLAEGAGGGSPGGSSGQMQYNNAGAFGGSNLTTAPGATTGSEATLTANNISSGTGLSVTSNSTAATGNTQTLLNAALSGANASSAQLTVAGVFRNTHTGTTSTNVGLIASASGGTNNTGLAVGAIFPGTAPVSHVQFDEGTNNSSVPDLHITNGTTGRSLGDGFQIGIKSDGSTVLFENKEPAGFQFVGNGANIVALTSAGRLGIGSFVPSAALANGPNLISDALTAPQSNSTTSISWEGNTVSSYRVALENTNTVSPSGLLIKSAAGSTPASGRSLAVVNGTTPALMVLNNNKVGLGTATPAETLDVTGNIQMNTIGNVLKVKEGTNASMGTATLVAGTVTVNNTLVTANTRIFVTVSAVGGTQGFLSVTRSAGSSFTITSSSVVETSTVAWFFVEPAP